MYQNDHGNDYDHDTGTKLGNLTVVLNKNMILLPIDMHMMIMSARFQLEN